MKLSIITPCLNRADFIEDAINSVLHQDNVEVEHIVVDGGSTDGTLELLARYPQVRVYSEPDKGIYDALNKGVRLAGGELIGFLNSDDLYEPNVLGPVVKSFQEHPEIEALSGGASILQKDSTGEWTSLASFPCIPPNELLLRATLGAPVFNAWFFRKSLIERLGGFDIQYRYVADRDFLIRMAFEGILFIGIDRNIYQYRMHPESFTLSGQDSGEDEFVFESQDMAKRYLRDYKTRKETRKIIRRWHSQLSLEQVMTAWHRRAYHRIAGYMLQGTRVDPAWPWLFGRKLIERLPYILKENSNGRERET